jgi:thioredoxin-related protein
MKLLIVMLLCVPLLAGAQGEKGIFFERHLNWQQVKAKARQENKYIFVDCYASWCGPCKQMDNEVYSSAAVGDFMNHQFISVKMQLDTSKLDDDAVKERYADAAYIRQHYNIPGYPTFLFFSPDGEIVHQSTSYLLAADFQSLAKDALDSTKQYYTLRKNFLVGKLSGGALPYLAVTAASMGDADLAKRVASTYKQNYLDKADDAEISSKDNVQFISNFSDLISGSNDMYFKFFFRHPNVIIGSVNGAPTYAKVLVGTVIQKEEIDDKVYRDGKPVLKNVNWVKIANAITDKYGKSYTNDLMVPARLSFYQKAKDWEQFAGLVNEMIKKYQPKTKENAFSTFTKLGYPINDDSWSLNNAAWSVFLGCKDRVVLEEAVRWSNLSIKLAPTPGGTVQLLDTKANLLYKLGRKKEAIATEKTAIKSATLSGQSFPEYAQSIEKMKKGVPTWPTH